MGRKLALLTLLFCGVVAAQIPICVLSIVSTLPVLVQCVALPESGIVGPPGPVGPPGTNGLPGVVGPMGVTCPTSQGSLVVFFQFNDGTCAIIQAIGQVTINQALNLTDQNGLPLGPGSYTGMINGISFTISTTAPAPSPGVTIITINATPVQ